MTVLAQTGDFNGLAVAIFAAVLAMTLVITRWAAKRTHSATEFYAAGRGGTAEKRPTIPSPSVGCETTRSRSAV